MLVSLMTAMAAGAEFRTSSGGRTLVRQANYQQTIEGIEPLETSVLEAPLQGPTVGAAGGCCDDPGCDGYCAGAWCGPCGPGWTFWGEFEFLMWWRTGQNLPPLVTSSPTTTDEASAGVLGVPGTQILYATETQSNDARPGGRLTVGAWFDPCGFSGIGTRLYSLGESTAHYDQDSNVVPVLARPIFNVELGIEDAVQLAYPNSLAGSVSVRNTSRVGGGDVFYRHLLFRDGCHRFDLIAGYQFARIDHDLSISSRLESIRTGGTIPIGTALEVTDLFDTRNTYHAGEIGLWGTYDQGPVTWSLLAKVGLGNMSQRTTIRGSTISTAAGGAPTMTDQGLLALDTNSGVFKRKVFAVSPELAFTGAYHLNDCIDLTFGYSFIYWTHVAQAGDQIDLSINPTQIDGALVGAARPEFPGNDSSFYVHGLNFGLQWIW